MGIPVYEGNTFAMSGCNTFQTHIDGMISMPIYLSVPIVLVIVLIFTAIGWIYGKIKGRKQVGIVMK